MSDFTDKKCVVIKGIRPSAIVKVKRDNTVSVAKVEFICSRSDCKVLAVVDQRGGYSEVREEKCELHRAGSGDCYFSTSGEVIKKYGLYAY